MYNRTHGDKICGRLSNTLNAMFGGEEGAAEGDREETRPILFATRCHSSRTFEWKDLFVSKTSNFVDMEASEKYQIPISGDLGKRPFGGLLCQQDNFLRS